MSYSASCFFYESATEHLSIFFRQEMKKIFCILKLFYAPDFNFYAGIMNNQNKKNLNFSFL